MYTLSRTQPVNPVGDMQLTQHEVWLGLVQKANNALPFVAIMQKCEVIERGEGWLVRDIISNDNPMRERVTFEPETLVLFERIDGDEGGYIKNIIGIGAAGELTLTFEFALTKQGIAEGSQAEREYFSGMEGAYNAAVASTLAAVRRAVEQRQLLIV